MGALYTWDFAVFRNVFPKDDYQLGLLLHDSEGPERHAQEALPPVGGSRARMATAGAPLNAR